MAGGAGGREQLGEAKGKQKKEDEGDSEQMCLRTPFWSRFVWNLGKGGDLVTWKLDIRPNPPVCWEMIAGERGRQGGRGQC